MMGGNALKNVKTRRLERAEYLLLEAEVLEKVNHLAKRLYVPRYFDSKESFGDLDIVYCVNEGKALQALKKRLFLCFNRKKLSVKMATFMSSTKSFKSISSIVMKVNGT